MALSKSQKIGKLRIQIEALKRQLRIGSLTTLERKPLIQRLTEVRNELDQLLNPTVTTVTADTFTPEERAERIARNAGRRSRSGISYGRSWSKGEEYNPLEIAVGGGRRAEDFVPRFFQHLTGTPFDIAETSLSATLDDRLIGEFVAQDARTPHAVGALFESIASYSRQYETVNASVMASVRDDLPEGYRIVDDSIMRVVKTKKGEELVKVHDAVSAFGRKHGTGWDELDREAQRVWESLQGAQLSATDLHMLKKELGRLQYRARNGSVMHMGSSLRHAMRQVHARALHRAKDASVISLAKELKKLEEELLTERHKLTSEQIAQKEERISEILSKNLAERRDFKKVQNKINDLRTRIKASETEIISSEEYKELQRQYSQALTDRDTIRANVLKERMRSLMQTREIDEFKAEVDRLVDKRRGSIEKVAGSRTSALDRIHGRDISSLSHESRVARGQYSDVYHAYRVLEGIPLGAHSDLETWEAVKREGLEESKAVVDKFNRDVKEAAAFRRRMKLYQQGLIRSDEEGKLGAVVLQPGFGLVRMSFMDPNKPVDDITYMIRHQLGVIPNDASRTLPRGAVRYTPVGLDSSFLTRIKLFSGVVDPVESNVFPFIAEAQLKLYKADQKADLMLEATRTEQGQQLLEAVDNISSRTSARIRTEVGRVALQKDVGLAGKIAKVSDLTPAEVAILRKYLDLAEGEALENINLQEFTSGLVSELLFEPSGMFQTKSQKTLKALIELTQTDDGGSFTQDMHKFLTSLFFGTPTTSDISTKRLISLGSNAGGSSRTMDYFVTRAGLARFRSPQGLRSAIESERRRLQKISKGIEIGSDVPLVGRVAKSEKAGPKLSVPEYLGTLSQDEWRELRTHLVTNMPEGDTARAAHTEALKLITTFLDSGGETEDLVKDLSSGPLKNRIFYNSFNDFYRSKSLTPDARRDIRIANEMKDFIHTRYVGHHGGLLGSHEEVYNKLVELSGEGDGIGISYGDTRFSARFDIVRELTDGKTMANPDRVRLRLNLSPDSEVAKLTELATSLERRIAEVEAMEESEENAAKLIKLKAELSGVYDDAERAGAAQRDFFADMIRSAHRASGSLADEDEVERQVRQILESGGVLDQEMEFEFRSVIKNYNQAAEMTDKQLMDRAETLGIKYGRPTFDKTGVLNPRTRQAIVNKMNKAEEDLIREQITPIIEGVVSGRGISLKASVEKAMDYLRDARYLAPVNATEGLSDLKSAAHELIPHLVADDTIFDAESQSFIQALEEAASGRPSTTTVTRNHSLESVIAGILNTGQEAAGTIVTRPDYGVSSNLRAGSVTFANSEGKVVDAYQQVMEGIISVGRTKEEAAKQVDLMRAFSIVMGEGVDLTDEEMKAIPGLTRHITTTQILPVTAGRGKNTLLAPLAAEARIMLPGDTGAGFGRGIKLGHMVSAGVAALYEENQRGTTRVGRSSKRIIKETGQALNTYFEDVIMQSPQVWEALGRKNPSGQARLAEMILDMRGAEGAPAHVLETLRGMGKVINDDTLAAAGDAASAAADLASSGARAAAGSLGPTKLADVANVVKGSTPLKWGIGAVGAVAALGLVRTIRGKDHTEENMQGPAYLPGGSAYAAPQMRATASPGTYNSFGAEDSGMTYEVRARGNVDPEQIKAILGSSINASVSMSTHSVTAPYTRSNQRQSVTDYTGGR